MKEAVVFTYYNVSNYGAFLQAYSLQEYLSNIGVSSYVYPHDATEKTSLIAKFIKLRSKKKSDEEIQYKTEMSKKVAECQPLLKTADKEKYYDVGILGSDEIWNVRNLTAYHYRFFFQRYSNAERTISYAACSGKTSKKDIKFFPYVKPGIKNLDGVSVRDDSTENFLKSIGVDAIRVLDPTFLIRFCDSELVQRHDYKYRDINYIFIYTYGLNQSDIDEIRQIAKTHNLKVIATGSYCPWADENPVPDPFEWIALIKNCTFMFTSTFHGTALALQCNRQFAVFGGGSPKIVSLLNEFRLMDRLVSSVNLLTVVLARTIDYAVIEKNIRLRRIDSENFLRRQFGVQPIVEEDLVNKNRGGGYAVKHKNLEVRRKSRSGGAFTAISDVFLDAGASVYGAVVNDDCSVSHMRAETKTDRDRMLGSKYVQSPIEGVLGEVIQDLKSGRIVLFSGTPCQTDAVRRMASTLKIEEKLYTVEFICHGVPSPRIWEDYCKMRDAVEVDFRDKSFGWRAHVEKIVTSKGKTIKSNVYSKLYYTNCITRPSCYLCPYTRYERYSDFLIADFWGIEKAAPGFNSDDIGVSLLYMNTQKAVEYADAILSEVEYKNITLSDCNQPMMKGNYTVPKYRERVWKDYYNNGIKYICRKHSTLNLKGEFKLRSHYLHSLKFNVMKMMRTN